MSRYFAGEGFSLRLKLFFVGRLVKLFGSLQDSSYHLEATRPIALSSQIHPLDRFPGGAAAPKFGDEACGEYDWGGR